MAKMPLLNLMSEPIVDTAVYGALVNYLNLREDLSSPRAEDETLKLCLNIALKKVEFDASVAIFVREISAQVQIQDKLTLPLSVNNQVKLIKVIENGIELPLELLRLTKGEEFYVLSLDDKAARTFDITLRVGYEQWRNVPANIQSIVLGVAAHLYENRFEENVRIPEWIREELLSFQHFRLGFG